MFRQEFLALFVVHLLSVVIAQSTTYPPPNPSGAVHLVGGEQTHEGLLEIYYNDTWGTVCSHGFDVNAARVVCQALGYGKNVGQLIYNRYSTATGPVFLDAVACKGNESSLLNCTHGIVGHTDCSHADDVFISCVADVRLSGGNNTQGRLEVFHNDEWGTVCDHLFDDNSARVACNSLGFGYVGRVLIGPLAIGPGVGTIWLNDVVCNGYELSIDLCRHSWWGNNYCTHANDVSISCLDVTPPLYELSVRLSGSPVPNEGRLEIYHSGSWGTVCDDGFTSLGAQVACRSLGIGPAGVGEFISNYYGPGTGNIWLKNVRCVGNETSIADCMHDEWNALGYCHHGEDVSISCRNTSVSENGTSVRLVSGPSNREGRLEIFHAGVWGTVCDDDFDDTDARVACYSLGFGSEGRTLDNRFGAGSGQIWLDNIECVGYEHTLTSCPHNGWGIHNCQHGEDVSISCNELNNDQRNMTTVRLAGSENPGEGRLEVFHDGIWGTICDDGFTDIDAAVACYGLGFGYNGWTIGNRYGAGSGRIWLDELFCSGSETFIGDCRHLGWGRHDCVHMEDVSIACTTTTTPLTPVRLVGQWTEGRLEVYHAGEWGTVCSDAFGDVSARVACYSLGFGYVGRTLHKQYGPATNIRIWLDGVQCVGHEKRLDECPHSGWANHDCSHNEDVSISCDSTLTTVSDSNTASVVVPVVLCCLLLVVVAVAIVVYRRRRAAERSRNELLQAYEPTLEVAENDDRLLEA